uniref:RZZ complex subunit KNTC1/ROD C-terminal domain-containing protein n=1 Tax=Branchiostoma floridae TaxID=7739 RepID=C3XRW7_BRAFL|eukprot:XP_002613426.1 hypothetical protein BRAFLDRAFT_123904 [Branchiostoma floridae]
MPWDDIEVGIGGDETANFGQRNESGPGLYQVDTLATVSNSGKDLLEQCSGRASYQLEASWEVKAITCVHCMKDMECKYEGTLLLMNKAVIPWSQAMEAFVAEALNWKHPRAPDLQHRYSMINLRKMLANYALRNYNVSEFTTAPALLKYILHKDQPTVMQDALQVVEAYPDHLKKTDAYNIRTHFLIQENRLSECMALLKSLPQEEVEVCVRRIAIWAELTLQDSIIADEEKEYGEFMTRSEYQDPEFRKAVLMEHLAKFFQSMTQTDEGEDGDAPADDEDHLAGPQKDPYSEWTYDSFFKEDGLVLDTAEAMPLTYQFTLACLPQADEGSERILDEIHASTSSIVQYLQESSLYQLAFQFSVQALGVCLQHVLMDDILNLPTQADQEAIANVGKDLARLVGQEDVLKACESLAADASWGHRLQKMKISFKDAFQKESAAKHKLLSTIIANEQTDLELILDYCRTFRLNPSDALLLYLEYLLLLQPTLDPVGTSTLDAHIKHASQCVSKVDPIIAQIPVKDILLKRMANLLVTKINFYDYERIRFVLSVMEMNMEREKTTFVWTIDLAKGLELLEFLWHYRRTQDPDQYELDFKPCADAEDEEQRKMPTDQVYVSAIQNMVNSCVKDQPRDVIPAPDEHSSMELRKLPGLDRKLLEGIRSLLLQVSDLQLAVATSRWVAKELPLGAEQVMALKACAFLTKKWKESLPEDSPNLEKASIMLNRVTAATQQIATQHVLYKYRLAKTPYLSLANSPARLIFKLYEDESIERRLVEKAGVFPDIHAAAEEISQIGSRDLGKIRVTLFEQWLHASGGSKQGEEQDSTETLNFNTEPENQEAKEEERSLHRMVYLMQFQAMEKSATFLLNIAYTSGSKVTYVSRVRALRCLLSLVDSQVIQTIAKKPVEEIRMVYLMQFQAMEKSATFLLNIAYTSGSKVTYVSRVRALRCLLSLVDSQVIQTIAKKPVEEIREYMKSLLYLAELEALHVPQTLESFNKSNKAALARGLWRNHNHEWRLKYLEHVLVRLSAISDLWQDKDACCEIQCYCLFPRCPLLLELDVAGFSRQFLQAGLPACALGCLLFLPDGQKRNKHIQTLLASGCSLGILDQMKELELARTPLSQAEQIVGEVYQYLDITNQYDILLDQPHYSSLQAYLVRHDRTSSLVRWLLQNDRLTEAIHLAQQYNQVHGDSSSSVTTKAGLQQLQDFLISQNLPSCVEMLNVAENGGDQPMDVDK